MFIHVLFLTNERQVHQLQEHETAEIKEIAQLKATLQETQTSLEAAKTQIESTVWESERKTKELGAMQATLDAIRLEKEDLAAQLQKVFRCLFVF